MAKIVKPHESEHGKEPQAGGVFHAEMRDESVRASLHRWSEQSTDRSPSESG